MSKAPEKAPRYDDFRPASPSASRVKRRNKAKDTGAEILLRKGLWSRGIRYRLHAGSLPSKPDIVSPKQRVLVFVDGDFRQGRHWPELEAKLKRRANSDYWIAKIAYNHARDLEQKEALQEQGWTVMRIWETEVAKNLNAAVEDVLCALGKQGRLERDVEEHPPDLE